MLKFKPLIRTSLSSDIVEQILVKIRTRELKPGERFPTEKELCEGFQVGRTTVREAIKILETTGLVRSINRARFICDPVKSTLHDHLIRNGITNILEVFETRKSIEIELVAMAARRAKPEDIDKMAKTLVEPGDVNEFIAGDISFHRAVAYASHNSFFYDVFNLISGLFYQHLKYFSLIEDIKEGQDFMYEVIEKHRKIIQAIESHNAPVARKVMRSHLNHVKKTILSKVDQKSK